MTPSEQAAKEAIPDSFMEVWQVTPDSEKEDIGDNKPVAWFLYHDHAYQYAEKNWPRYFKLNKVNINLNKI